MTFPANDTKTILIRRPPVRREGQTFFRLHSDLPRDVRLQLHVQRSDVLLDLSDCDRAIEDLALRRRQMIDVLDRLREQLWPRMQRVHPARPPNHNQPPIPPAQANAIALQGRKLRWVCLALLARNGTLALTDLHTLIHAHGYTVAHPHRVKALADALGYETRLGRCQRVERGVYQLSGRFRPRSGRHGHPAILDDSPWHRSPGRPDDQPMTDPETHLDPDQWAEYPGFGPEPSRSHHGPVAWRPSPPSRTGSPPAPVPAPTTVPPPMGQSRKRTPCYNVAMLDDVIQRSGGRQLGLADFGPVDATADAVLWCHGGPGSRLEPTYVAERAAAAAGLRLIGIDRPGYGRRPARRSRCHCRCRPRPPHRRTGARRRASHLR